MANHTYREANTRPARPGYSSRAASIQPDLKAPCCCKVCGRLECLCRPRFFAGQLLTEDDLNRLDQYIVKKQRLHNRHLHGWGVVCGLELRCDPCDDSVLVTSGYALSPCGEDIVVCQDDRVPVCELIQECLDRERKLRPCEPPHHGLGKDCKDVTDDWLLMIRYEEHPSRGITALRNASAEARCQPCEGVTFGGCDCDDSGKTKRQSYKTSPRPQPAQCEPTILCESYRYEVCRITEPGEMTSAMGQRFRQCVQPFVDYANRFSARLADYQDSGTSPQKLRDLCCDMKGALLDLLSTHLTHKCNLLERVLQINCPEPGLQTSHEAYLKVFKTSLDAMATVWLHGVLDCLCMALLPPCETSKDQRVVLGKVTVHKGDCKVLRVCNWITERKFATTFPNLQYWLSWLPVMPWLRRKFEEMCCETPEWLFGGLHTVQSTESTSVFTEGQKVADFANIAADVLSGKTRNLSPQAFFMGMMGHKDADDKPLMSDKERANLLQSLLLKHVGAPLFRAASPAGVPPITGLAAGLAVLSRETWPEEIAALRTELKEMNKVIALQKIQIEGLAARVDKNK